jgi:hypothetical protein
LSTAGWLPITPTSRCGDGDLYLLRNDVASERWALTFFRAPRLWRGAVCSWVLASPILGISGTDSLEEKAAFGFRAGFLGAVFLKIVERVAKMGEDPAKEG